MRSTSERLKWDISAPNPDLARPKPAAAGSAHDRWMRALGYLLVGLVIPRLALIFDKIAVSDPDYWIGNAWFLLAAIAIWEANRWVAVALRAHLDWLRQPFLKLIILLGANLACTVPLSIGTVRGWLWFVHSPFPAFDWLTTIRVIATNNTVTVLFLLHAYETLFLIRERHGDRRRLEQLERARLQAELEAMKSQLAPHFLFNCQNTLSALIERDPPAAAEFNSHLADVSRYLLAHQDRNLVPLTEELAFLRSYVRLMELRFGPSLRVTLPAVPANEVHLLPPAALQVLIENAIKHNRFSSDEPLAIDVVLETAAIAVVHPHRPKPNPRPGPGTGLANLRERAALLLPGPLEIDAGPENFRVRLPLATP